ncbi:Bax inhibitor-1/YccA family protein [Candidatus Cardinium hertigii]|uniref:Bax inhibitor-1/YccA family protein n=1 Tax=Candidatus Cardinium hertigii TaxID=247481 RepID=UPI003D7ECB7B
MNNYINNHTSNRYAIDDGLQRYMVKVYAHMAFGLFITAIAAAVTYHSPPLIRLLFAFDQFGNMLDFTFFGSVVLFSPVLIVIYVRYKLSRITFSHARYLLVLYAALWGVSLSGLMFIYTIDSLHTVFLVTACTFSAMSIYGYTTKRDLTALGSFCRMALFGLIISALVNFFLQSGAVYFLTSFIGVVVFIGFVAYDTQKLKKLYYEVQDTALAKKVALIGALHLYLDFINIFLHLLQLWGKRKGRN